MTRKQRGETYDLNSARDRAAFEALLDREGSGDDAPARGGAAAGRGCKKANAAREKRGKERFFRLRDDAAAAPAGAGGSGSGSGGTGPQRRAEDLAALSELLGGPASPLPPDLVGDVYDGHGGSLEAALDALLAMAAASGGGSGRGSGGDPAGPSTSSGGAASCAAPAATGSPGGSWADLPPDAAFAVLARLTPPELARLAAASRELRAAVGQLQRAARVLRVPPGLSYNGVAGMVRTHPRASAVDMTRAVADPGHWATTALAPRPEGRDEGPSARRLRAAALEEQEARLQQLLLAVAEGGGARRRAARGGGASVPVSRLVARGLETLTDRVMADALGALHSLSSLDISHCSRLTDKTWVLLGRYEAQETDSWGPGGASEDEEDRNLSQGFAGWQGWREYAEGRAGGAGSSGSDGDGAGSASSGAAWGDEEGGSGGPDADADAPAWAGRAAAAAAGMAALRVSAGAAAAAVAVAPARQGPRGLQSVCVRSCSGLTDHGARQLLGGPATKGSLESLDVSRTGVTSAGLQLPPLGALKALDASHCRGLTALSLLLPPTHPLAAVDLSACHYLRELNISAASLTQLNIPACRTLYRLRLRAPRLEVLSAPQCLGLHSLFDDAWEAPKLRELNFFGCRQLSGSHLNTVLEGCPALETLNVNGCWGLGALHLSACLELRSLDASGCRSLTALSAPSALLSDLAAVACGRLEALTLAPERPMARLLLTNCGALRAVHAQPPPKGPAAPAGAAAADAGAKTRRGGGRGAGQGQGLALGGCASLSPEARAQLATLVQTV